jgi:CDP-diacylglycerol---serine O-phosphatidyltransferase
MAEPRPRRHFSMFREFQLADLITIGNGFAGMGAILAAVEYVADKNERFLKLVFVLLPIALVCDFLDGRVARWRHKQSALGQELDSLADVVSFGVAPAVLAFALGMRGLWDALVLLYFVGCGISRLARYNVTAASMSDEAGKVRYFEGTPIPTSLFLALVLFVSWLTGRIGDNLLFGAVTLGPGVLHPIVLLYALSGSAMVSKTLHIPKP